MAGYPGDESMKNPLMGMKAAMMLALGGIIALAGGMWIRDHHPRDFLLSGKANPNTADQALLQTLPNIGPARAQAIVEYRREKALGGVVFRRVEDLQGVRGIGPVISQGLQPWLTFETDDNRVHGSPIDGD